MSQYSCSKRWKEKNRLKVNENQRRYRKENGKEICRKAQRKRNRNLAIWLRNYKNNLKCKNCPEKHPACLQFHHLDRSTKENSIARMLGKGYGKKKIMEEIKKCDVLCANCHAKLHDSEKNQK